MSALKISVIGAGSTYTPELMEGLIKRKNELDLKELCLMDINTKKLGILAKMVTRMFDYEGIKCKITSADSYKEAIMDSDFVLGQIRVGGLQARIKDEKIPLKYNLIGQETTGAGGFMNALRTIPVMMEIAGCIEKYSKDAFLINFSNPSGIIAELLLNHTNIKMLGLCNVPIHMKENVMGCIPENTKDVDIEYVGLNHLSWITKINCDNVDILPALLKEKKGLTKMNNIANFDMDEDLLYSIKAIPSGYLQYFYYREHQLKHLNENEKCRGEVCMQIEEELLKMYSDTKFTKKPEILNERGGYMYSEAAISLLSAIANDKNERHIADVKNNGALEFMEKDDVVELDCLINSKGASPIKIRNFTNQHIICMMRTLKAYEKHTVKAGLYGDENEAINALLVNPLIGDFDKAKKVLDDLLEAHKEYLPQFKNLRIL